jgi:RecJ-like exonuclease
MTLKVWCADCEGGGVIGVGHNCPTCDGRGFTFVEAVQLPEGRVLVVPRDALDAIARERVEAEKRFVRITYAEMDGHGLDENGARDDFLCELAALFGGKVYEVKAVGMASTRVVQEDTVWHDALCVDGRELSPRRIAGHLIAVGLKEVGK